MARILNRQVLARAGIDQQTIEALSGTQRSAERAEDTLTVLTGAPVVLLGPNDALPKGRVLAAGEGLEKDDAGAGKTVRLSLAPSGVTPGEYGSDAHLVRVTVDRTGRVLKIEAFDLNSDNVTEGETNLFFTDQRAREALLGGAGILYDDETGEIAADPDTVAFHEYGTWAPIDGSPDGLSLIVSRAAYARIGRVVTLEAQITYPGTASSNGAAITGLPFVPDGTGAGSYYSNGAAGALFQTGGKLYPAASSGTAVLNSQLSGATINLTYTYIAEDA